ncbi:TetR/AcrR family transcriptional regulator [Kribbella antibiotica]|nr:TetR/AcrR family transcriptional regulator [Kribbella antibiotica]
MPKPGETKQRMLMSTVTLLRERGARGTSIDAVLAHSGAPRGSVYHHFPGGRAELVTTAVQQAGDFISSVFDAVSESGDIRGGLELFAQFWKQALIDSDFTAGCPVVALTVDGHDDVPDAVETVAGIFARWHDASVRLLEQHGYEPARAQRLATLTVAAIEGAVVLCQARRSADPLDEVLVELLAILD